MNLWLQHISLCITKQGRRKEMKSGEAKWLCVRRKNLINSHDFYGTRMVEQHMQQWKPMVAFRLMQIIDRFGYNTSDNDRGGATVGWFI